MSRTNPAILALLVVAAILALSILADNARAQGGPYVYCAHPQTNEIRVFEYGCPVGWIWKGRAS